MSRVTNLQSDRISLFEQIPPVATAIIHSGKMEEVVLAFPSDGTSIAVSWREASACSTLRNMLHDVALIVGDGGCVSNGEALEPVVLHNLSSAATEVS